MLRCEECGKRSEDGKDWRSLLTVDDEAVMYCPECAEREFRPARKDGQARPWREAFGASLRRVTAEELIREELKRLRATTLDVGPYDVIGVKDYGNGYAQLGGSPRKDPDFSWYGKADEILERLAGLPDGSGPEAIRSEFA